MKLIRIAAFALPLFATALVSCSTKNLPPATFAAYDACQNVAANSATITGTHTDETADQPESTAYVATIDGKIVIARASLISCFPLASGPHSLVVSFWTGNHGADLPVRLDAKPGASYIIRAERGELKSTNLWDTPRAHYVSIQDQKTGEIALRKTAAEPANNPERYQGPSTASAATIHGTTTLDLLDRYGAYPAAVDGLRISEIPMGPLLPTKPDYEGTIKLAPGLHALAIGLVNIQPSGLYPVMLDAKPGASYVIRFEHGIKRSGDSRWYIFTVWIEDEKSGAIILPKSDLPIGKLLF